MSKQTQKTTLTAENFELYPMTLFHMIMKQPHFWKQEELRMARASAKQANDAKG